MRSTVLVCLALLASGQVFAQAPAAAAAPAVAPYKVVFDLTSQDPLDHKALIRWIKEISSANPRSDIEVVMYAKGVELVTQTKTTLAAEVKEAMALPRVTFKVCGTALKNQGIDKAQLLPKVEIVPDGIGEIVARQKDGWGYIKVMH